MARPRCARPSKPSQPRALRNETGASAGNYAGRLRRRILPTLESCCSPASNTLCVAPMPWKLWFEMSIGWNDSKITRSELCKAFRRQRECHSDGNGNEQEGFWKTYAYVVPSVLRNYSSIDYPRYLSGSFSSKDTFCSFRRWFFYENRGWKIVVPDRAMRIAARGTVAYRALLSCPRERRFSRSFVSAKKGERKSADYALR